MAQTPNKQRLDVCDVCSWAPLPVVFGLTM